MMDKHGFWEKVCVVYIMVCVMAAGIVVGMIIGSVVK